MLFHGNQGMKKRFNKKAINNSPRFSVKFQFLGYVTQIESTFVSDGRMHHDTGGKTAGAANQEHAFKIFRYRFQSRKSPRVRTAIIPMIPARGERAPSRPQISQAIAYHRKAEPISRL